MYPKPRIFISARSNHSLPPLELAIKQTILSSVAGAGFELEEFMTSGSLANINYNLTNVQRVFLRCQGAVIICLPKYEVNADDGYLYLPTNFNHVEGTLALSLKIPTLVIVVKHSASDGILYHGMGHHITYIEPDGRDILNKIGRFWQEFPMWEDNVNKRYHVFLGYSSGATTTAQAIRDFLENKGVRVLDWKRDFKKAHTILDQIEEATNTCLGGIFLFTADDELVGSTSQAAPRDNVVFEAGFFIHAKGPEQNLIILEDGVKMPADLGGHIYLNLKDRHDIQPIEGDIWGFIENNI